jgi:hypothetical protein
MHTDRCGNTGGYKWQEKGNRKEFKHKSKFIEVILKWSMKCMTILVIIGATGIVTRGLRKNLLAVPGKHSIDSIHKTAVLGP